MNQYWIVEWPSDDFTLSDWFEDMSAKGWDLVCLTSAENNAYAFKERKESSKSVAVRNGIRP